MKKVAELIEEAETLLTLAKEIQIDISNLKEQEAKLEELRRLYHAWYQSSLREFNAYNEKDERHKFEKEYEGGTLSPKILKFLTNGLSLNPLYDPSQPNPFISKWTYSVTTSFNEPLLKQSNYLSMLELRITDICDGSQGDSHHSGHHSIKSNDILSFSERKELVTLLLAIPSIARRNNRVSVINELPTEIKTNVVYNETDKVHVLNILNACLQYSNGIEELKNILLFFEGDSIPMKKIDDALNRLFSKSD